MLIAVIVWGLGRTELQRGEGKCQKMLGPRDERCRKSQRDPGEQSRELRKEIPQENERQVPGIRKEVCREY